VTKNRSDFTVIIDTREQTPYGFQDITNNKKPVEVTTTRSTLKSGDYSIEGFIDRLAVERKNISDLFSTFGKGRKRFERELLRLKDYEFAAVVAEADWETIFKRPPEFTSLKPKTIFRSVITWQQRYGVHFWMCPGRWFAEQVTYRILERFWIENNEI